MQALAANILVWSTRHRLHAEQGASRHHDSQSHQHVGSKRVPFYKASPHAPHSLDLPSALLGELDHALVPDYKFLRGWPVKATTMVLMPRRFSTQARMNGVALPSSALSLGSPCPRLHDKPLPDHLMHILSILETKSVHARLARSYAPGGWSACGVYDQRVQPCHVDRYSLDTPL
jgi:hypothetical protein